MTLAVSSEGTLLKMGDGAGPEVFTAIAEVRDIGGPALAQGTEEVTHHGSGGWREFIATLKEGGEVTFQVNVLNDATQGPGSGLLDAFDDGEAHNFQIVFPTATPLTADFAAIVTGFTPDAPVEGALTADATLQITGEVTWT